MEQSTWDAYTWAQNRFEAKDYAGAARHLESVLAGADADHRLTDARLLLARAYFHSAQLKRAEEVAREVLAEDPTEGYAALLLARTLRRQSRPEEAAGPEALAAALGVTD